MAKMTFTQELNYYSRNAKHGLLFEGGEFSEKAIKNISNFFKLLLSDFNEFGCTPIPTKKLVLCGVRSIGNGFVVQVIKEGKAVEVEPELMLVTDMVTLAEGIVKALN